MIYPWIARNRMLLSRLGATSALTWVLHRCMRARRKRAVAQSQLCKDDACELPPVKRS